MRSGRVVERLLGGFGCDTEGSLRSLGDHVDNARAAKFENIDEVLL